MKISIGEFNSDISDMYPKIPVPDVAEAISKSGAEVVGVEEGGGEIPQLAKDLGWPYYDVRTQIVSKYPLISPPGGANLFDLVEPAPGQVFALENVHLPSSGYGPMRVRNGATPAQLMAGEQGRLTAIRSALSAIRAVRSQGIPTFLVGDFNSPSALDWTTAAVGVRKYRPFAFKWPVSEIVLRAGFTDSYRSVYPDPTTDLGITWPAVKSPTGPAATKPADRIDFIYSSGKAAATASRIVGEPGAPEISASVDPWPSDHRAIASDFQVTLATPRTFVSALPQLVAVGTPITVAYHAPGNADSLSIEPADPNGVAPAPVGLAATGTSDGSVQVATDALSPGAYQLRLHASDGSVLASAPVWVERAGQQPVVSTSKSSYRVGEAIDVSWSWAPGDRFDWIGIYHRGADPNVAYYIDWLYTEARTAGSLKMGGSAHGRWPLPPGRYSVYLLKDDLYVKIAGANFTIRG